jgi:tRNA(Ile)-lysidine synthase
MSKSDLQPIEKSVKNALQHNFPDKKKVSLVIGVSGGADSMCLLHVLNTLGVELHIVHINYQKRGRSADKDARLVEDTAAAMEVDCKCIAVDPDEAGGANFQQWARQLRYNAFDMEAERAGVDGIAVGHHEDDQVETILQKIFRGGGLASWQAMQVWDGRLFRPLLGVSRAAIERYCREEQVPYREDASNSESDFARNFLRNEWLNDLEKHFPGWRTNVLRVAGQGEVFAVSLQYIFQHIADDKNRLDREKFLALEEDLQKSMLLYYVSRVDAGAEVSRDALKELSKVQKLQTGKSIQLTQDLELMRDRAFLKLVMQTGDAASFITLTKEEAEQKAISFNGLKLSVEEYSEPNFGKALYLDAADIAWPIRLRRWRDGDRFQPLGMDGHQSVADHLTNRKVSAAAKGKALVLESFEETICAVIFPPIENRHPPGTISELVKCAPSTRSCLIINRII